MKTSTKIAPQRLPERRFTQKPTAGQWGKDHWSLLAYIECRCVENGGRVELAHMRCNPKRHPGLATSDNSWKPACGTRLKYGSLPHHDDHDCADDLEKAGLIEHIGTGINPVYKLTTEGWRVVGLLRQHKAAGQNFASFNYPKPPVVPTVYEKVADLVRRSREACTCDGGNTTGCSACVAERELARMT